MWIIRSLKLRGILEERFKTIFVLGATASGKSEWGLRWAEEFSGRILNCDSVQVYQGLDIGAAKPSLEELSRVPHDLISFVKKGQNLTAGEYREHFFSQLKSLEQSNLQKNPLFVVGGSGFYFQAIEKGMYPVRDVNPEIAKQIDLELSTTEGAQRLYQELQERDPLAAQKIHFNDVYRLGRALEIIRSEGRPLSEIQKDFSSQQGGSYPYPLLKIGVQWPREKLKERVERRVELMFDRGLLQEVLLVLQEGFGDWRALGSVGYRECVAYLRQGQFLDFKDLPEPQGPCLKELKLQIVQSTMALAKKQKTWFQRDGSIFWYDGESGFEQATERVREFLLF